MIDCPKCKASFHSTQIQSKAEHMFRTNPIISAELEETCPKCSTVFKHEGSALYWVE